MPYIHHICFIPNTNSLQIVSAQFAEARTWKMAKAPRISWYVGPQALQRRVMVKMPCDAVGCKLLPPKNPVLNNSWKKTNIYIYIYMYICLFKSSRPLILNHHDPLRIQCFGRTHVMPDQFCLMRQQTCQRSCEAEIMEAIPPYKKFPGGVPWNLTSMEAFSRRKTVCQFASFLISL